MGAAQQRELLDHSIGRHSTHPDTDRHVRCPRSNLPHAGMGCSRRRCSSPWLKVSFQHWSLITSRVHTIRRSNHRRLGDAHGLDRHTDHQLRYDRNIVDRLGSTSLCFLVDGGRSRHRNELAALAGAAGVVPT